MNYEYHGTRTCICLAVGIEPAPIAYLRTSYTRRVTDSFLVTMRYAGDKIEVW